MHLFRLLLLSGELRQVVQSSSFLSARQIMNWGRVNKYIWHIKSGASVISWYAVKRVKSKQRWEQVKPVYYLGMCLSIAMQAVFLSIIRERQKYSTRSLSYFNQMESKMFRKLKIHLFLQSCIPSVFRHLWNLFACRIWQPLVPWKYFFPMQLTESQAGCRRHWSKPFIQVLLLPFQT